MGFAAGSVVKNQPAMQKMQETWVWSLCQEDPLEEEMATHSNILARKIPPIEEPGYLQSIAWHNQTQLKWLSMHTQGCHIYILLLLFSSSVASDSLWAHGLQHARLPCPSPSPGACSVQTHVHRIGDAIQPPHPLFSPSPPALSLSQHQGLF